MTISTRWASATIQPFTAANATLDAKVADHSRKRRQSASETDGYEGVVAILDGSRRVRQRNDPARKALA
jgi:hypothetical protein